MEDERLLEQLRDDQRLLETRLREARDRLRFYTDLMSHDLRNYSQTMGGYLESLLAGRLGPLEAEQQRVLQVCQRQTGRIQRLLGQVHNLLEVHEHFAAQDAVPLQRTHLAAVLETAVAEVRNEYPERQLQIEVDVPADAWVRVCPRFGHAVYCIVCNAVAHNPAPAPRVWLSAAPTTRKSSPHWRLRVEDDGPGIPEAFRSTLLAEAGTFERPGSGVGLRLTSAVLSGCGGELRFGDRVPGASSQGARATIEVGADSGTGEDPA